jgi:chaperonin GroEL
MQYTKEFEGKEAREKMLAGMERVFKMVAPTYGGNGRNVVFNKWSGTPVASNDGENIADRVIPQDESEQQGANLIKQVARNTNAILEDGSTATYINSFTLAKKGHEMLASDPRISPVKLRKEMKEAAKKVLEEIKNSVIPINDITDLEKLAITSVEDVEYGKTIAKAIYDAGDNGIVYVNETDKEGMTVEQGEGYQFHEGMITPYLISNIDRMETKLEDVAVLLTEVQLNFPDNDVLKLVDGIVSSGTKNILIICDELHPKLIEFAYKNRFAGKFNMCIVKKPMAKDALEDIASVLGATAMTQNKGLIIPRMEYLGRAKKIVVTQKTTTIYADENIIPKTQSYIESLNKQLETIEDEISKSKLQERIAKLTGKVFTVNIGATTEAGLKQLRDKADDAVNSLRKVWKNREDGVVAGGGSALYHIGTRLSKGENLTNGEKVVYDSCKATMLQMLKNGGEEPAMLDRITDEGGGYNALTMEYTPDMFAAGIIDATKVISTSFTNAASFGADFVTYENLITNYEVDTKAI